MTHEHDDGSDGEGDPVHHAQGLPLWRRSYLGALCWGAPAQSKDGGPVFHGDTATCFGDVCIACRGCGRNRGAEQIRGKVSHRHACDAKCLASKGPSCECACGGKNHGASYSA